MCFGLYQLILIDDNIKAICTLKVFLNSLTAVTGDGDCIKMGHSASMWIDLEDSILQTGGYLP